MPAARFAALDYGKDSSALQWHHVQKWKSMREASYPAKKSHKGKDPIRGEISSRSLCRPPPGPATHRSVRTNLPHPIEIHSPAPPHATAFTSLGAVYANAAAEIGFTCCGADRELGAEG